MIPSHHQLCRFYKNNVNKVYVLVCRHYEVCISNPWVLVHYMTIMHSQVHLIIYLKYINIVYIL